MLNSQEEQIWDDVQRFWAEEAEEPAVRDEVDPPAVIVGGAFGVILLLLFGEVQPALGVAVATATGWTLWHYQDALREWWARGASPVAPPEQRDDA